MEYRHPWSFSLIGGMKRVNLQSGQDLMHLDQLDQKLWTALSCPVQGLEIDARTLELIDFDKDGQIRVPEVLAAVTWALSVLKSPDQLLLESPDLPLAAIDESREEGQKLLSSARVILRNLGKPDAGNLSVDEASDTARIFSSSRFNGDGIIATDATDDPELVSLIGAIMEVEGTVSDRSGHPGITAMHVTSFLENCQSFSEWVAQSEQSPALILPFGERTGEAYQAYQVLKSKVDDFFLRCRLAEFDPDSAPVLNLQRSRVEAISEKDLPGCLTEIATYPLAKIAPQKPLPLHEGINPAWEAAVARFVDLVVQPLLPAVTSLSEADWQLVTRTFLPYETWQQARSGARVEPLGVERVREILVGNCGPALLDLIRQDLALESEVNDILRVEKLVRFNRDLFTLLKNFVTFRDFYTPGKRAIFQAGTLYIDQRSLDLCIRVNDMAKHAEMVSFSGMYLLYCECFSKPSHEKMTIVAALTNGDTDNLVVGRNAVFYDRKGRDWDATVVRIVENPISIRQAFWSPYRRIQRLIEAQIQKMAAARDAKIMAEAVKKIEETPAKTETAPPAPPPDTKPAQPPFDVGKFVGIFAAISLALGALGTALTAIVSGFLGLEWWKMPLAIAGLLLVVSGPSMVMAYLKLRKRNLAPILDANGWAVNARANINIQFGRMLTRLAALPPGARVNWEDPFSQKKIPWFWIICGLAFLTGATLWLLFHFGLVKFW